MIKSRIRTRILIASFVLTTFVTMPLSVLAQKVSPVAPNRAQVEQLIRDLEAKRTASDTQRLGLKRPPPATAPPPEHPPERAPDRPIYARWWFWTGIAVVAVAGGVTAYELSTGGPPSTSLGNIVFGK